MDRKKAKISKVNDRSLYGKTPLESWTGTVVSYDAQKDQLEGGWGWRYKVRIMGENTQSDTITSEKIDYAYCLLPTTAGSGGAYKLRSVRISQGDYVYGVKGGGGPTMIIGVYPRTSKQVPGSGNFENLSGFYGSLKNTGILDGEYNEQIGPETPGSSGLDPKEWNKATANDPSEKIKEIIPEAERGDEIAIEKTEKNSLENKVNKVNDTWELGDNLNTATMEYLKESFDKDKLSPTTWEAALKQASEQGIDGYEEYVVKDIVQEEVQPVKENYVQKLKSALARQNFDAYERSVLNVDNTTLRDDGTVVPEFLLARTLNYRRELVRERDNLLSLSLIHI